MRSGGSGEGPSHLQFLGLITAADDCTFPGNQGRPPGWLTIGSVLDEITLLPNGSAGSRLSAFQGGKLCSVTSTPAALAHGDGESSAAPQGSSFSRIDLSHPGERETGSHEEDTPSFQMGGAKVLGDLRYALRRARLVWLLLLCKSLGRPAVDQPFDCWSCHRL